MLVCIKFLNGELQGEFFNELEKITDIKVLFLFRLVREMVSGNQNQQVERVLAVLGDLAKSQNPQLRKGGLIGLAAAAIALGKVSTFMFLFLLGIWI